MGSRLEANSNAVRKRIQQHTFDDEEGEEYEASAFGGFGDYFRRKKLKLQNLDVERRRQNADKPQIFKGIVAHVNGYTQPSLNDLHGMIVDYGGGFLQYLDGKTMVTHVIASNLTPKKKVEFRRYRIVKPAWIVDSIKAGKLLPWEQYRVVDEGVKQNILSFQDGSLRSQANAPQKGYREQTDTSWYTGHVQELAEQLDLQSQDPFSLPGFLQKSYGSGSSEKERLISAENKEPEDAQFHTQEPHQETDYGEEWDSSGTKEGPTKQDKAERASTIEEPGSDDGLPSFSLNAGDPPGLSESKESAHGKKLTAEEHNAILLADPKIWKSTVVNPGFLKQYYEESRLHHLSTWKAELKSKLQALAQERTLSQKARQKPPKGSRRYVLHVDFDSFFAAVSLRKHPELIDKPVVVAHGNGSGSEIASCNYPARKFGVKNGMWMKKAQELCPELKVLPYDFKAYEAASRDFYDAIMDTGGVVQSVSIDEALIDMSLACAEAGGHEGKGVHEGSIWREQTKADEIAQQLRNTIKNKTGCAVSVGIGGNILLAKLALRKAKPAGQYQVKPDDILEFTGELAVRDLPGVAWSLGGKLEELGVKYIKDVRELTKERLMTQLGPKTGERIWEYARGIDRSEVGEQVVRKSVSAEINWGIRFVTQEQADEFIHSICEELQKRLVNEGVKGRQFTMKIMKRAADAPLDPPKHLGHGKCDVFNKSTSLNVSTNDKEILTREALSILKGFGFRPGELRGIGVQVTKLEPLKGPNRQDSSQRRLQFKIPDSKPPASIAPTIDGDDIVDSPQKSVKFAKHPAATLHEPAADEPAAPLNLTGTQFILPSQADPSVIAELPEDIRSRLGAKPQTPTRDKKQPSLNFESRPLAESGFEIPRESQIDPEILAALPEDIRKEVLASYRSPPKVLPMSPSKPRAKGPVKKTVTPTKKRGLLSRKRGSKNASNSTLTQSNFVSRPDSAAGLDKDVDPEFLAALPEDIRAEVLAQQRKSRLQSRGGLMMRGKRRLRGRPISTVKRELKLPPRPPKPTFTAKKLSLLPDLRETISQWVKALEGEEPDEDDVAVLAKYLAKVVEVEKDMDKAANVVRWLIWVVGNLDTDDQQLWQEAVESLKKSVNDAVKRRGLGALNLD